MRYGGSMRIGWFLPFMIVAHGALSFAHVDGSAFIVELQAEDVAARSAIAKIIHIDLIFEDRVFSVVNMDDLKRLKQLKTSPILSVEILEERIPDYYVPLSGVIDFPIGESDFHTYDEMLLALRQLERDHPS